MAFDITTFQNQLTLISKVAWKERFEIPQDAVGVGSLTSLIASLQATADGTYSTDQIQAAEAVRSAYGNFVSTSDGGVGGELLPLYSQLLQAVLIDILNQPRSTSANPFENFSLIEKWMIDNSLFVDSRSVVFDTTPTVSGTGSGVVSRLTVDQFGEPLDQARAPLDITLTCASDASSPNVQFGQEVFNFSYPGALDLLETFLDKTTDSPSSIASFNNGNGSYLSDCDSFGATAVSATVTGLGAWTPQSGSFTGFSITDDGRFQSIGQVTNGLGALCLTVAPGSDQLNQVLRNLSQSNAIHAKMEVYVPVGMTDCAITIDWGTKSQTFSIGSGLTAGQWNTIELDLDKDLYPYQFSNGLNTTFSILCENVGDDIRISNIQVKDFSFILGSFWSVTPGETAFLAGPTPKTFVFSDTADASTSCKIQASFAAVAGRAWPSSGATTIPNF